MSIMNMEMYDALIEAGASESKSRAAAAVIRDPAELASKNDIDLLKGDIDLLKKDIDLLRSDVKKDIALLRSEVKKDIALLRTEVKNDIDLLRSEVKNDIDILKGDFNLLRWMVGFVLALASAILVVLIVQ